MNDQLLARHRQPSGVVVTFGTSNEPVFATKVLPHSHFSLNYSLPPLYKWDGCVLGRKLCSTVYKICSISLAPTSLVECLPFSTERWSLDKKFIVSHETKLFLTVACNETIEYGIRYTFCNACFTKIPYHNKLSKHLIDLVCFTQCSK